MGISVVHGGFDFGADKGGRGKYDWPAIFGAVNHPVFLALADVGNKYFTSAAANRAKMRGDGTTLQIRKATRTPSGQYVKGWPDNVTSEPESADKAPAGHTPGYMIRCVKPGAPPVAPKAPEAPAPSENGAADGKAPEVKAPAAPQGAPAVHGKKK